MKKIHSAMIKRTLAAISGMHEHLSVERWSIAVAAAQSATVTVVPIIDVKSWLRLMPSMMTSGQAARILDSKPWEVAPSHIDRLRENCEVTFRDSSVPWEFRSVEDNSWDVLISETRFHDLLVFGIRGIYDQAIVPDPLKSIGALLGQGACPVLAVPADTREIRRVAIAFSGTVASSRSLKRFVHLGLWPDAPVNVICKHEDLAILEVHLSHAEQYLKAHHREVQTTPFHGTDEELCRFLLRSDADLIVAGSSHRNWLGIETTSVVLSGLISQSAVPVFIAN